MEQKRTPSLVLHLFSATLRSLAGVQEEGEMEKRLFKWLVGAEKDFKGNVLPVCSPLRPGSFTSVREETGPGGHLRTSPGAEGPA